MKKLLLIATLSLVSSVVMAKSYGPAGCGLGSVVLGDSKGLLMNVFAATTNGTSGNQTFGMTSGTSNCDVSSKTKVASVVFVEANKVALANDISRGEGETLASLDRIYGCTNHAEIGKVLKSNYSNIFAVDNADAINGQIEGLIKTNNVCM